MSLPTAEAQITRTAFAQVPIVLLEQCSERRLRGALFVYLWLWHYAGIRDQAFPSIQRLAAECHMKPDDVRKALKWLTEEGWITRTDRAGSTSLFHIRYEKTPCRTPPPKGVPLPRKGDPLKGVALPPEPLPQMGDPTPPPEGGPNKNQLTREEIKQEDLLKGSSPQPARSVSREDGTNPRALDVSDRDLGLNPRAKPDPERKDPYAAKKLCTSRIPADLLDCQELLPEFWACKKGRRSERVFNRVCAKLRTWTPEGRRESLEAAIASGWGDVFPPRQAALGLPNGSSRRTSTQTTHDSRLQVGEFLRANGLA